MQKGGQKGTAGTSEKLCQSENMQSQEASSIKRMSAAGPESKFRYLDLT